MGTQLAMVSVLTVGVMAGGGLGWLQWLILKRLVGRPNTWVATSVVGAAVSTPLSTTMLLETLVRDGLPAAMILPVGLGLLGVQLVLGTLMVGVVAWGTRRAP